jgi:predicted transcriptional regulator
LAVLARPAQMDRKVTLESPAIDVMTDLELVFAAVVDPHATMESANLYMIQRGVRMLLVLNADKTLAGLITTNDIMGEKPVRLIHERQIKHGDILVLDVMTPVDQIDAIDFADVAHAMVGHVVSSLKAAGRQHALVMERERKTGVPQIRGIFSLSQIARQLGYTIQTNEVAKSFAEIEAVIMADSAMA